MKQLMLLAAIALAIILAGCRSVEVTNHGQDYVRNSDGSPVLVDGKPIVFSKGWSVDHFQHWMITKADTINASVKDDSIDFGMNGLNTQPDAKGLSQLVDTSIKGATELAAKVGAAMVSSGGTAGYEAIAAYVNQFISNGGNPAKATVTVSDGNLTCSDGSCTMIAPVTPQSTATPL